MAVFLGVFDMRVNCLVKFGNNVGPRKGHRSENLAYVPQYDGLVSLYTFDYIEGKLHCRDSPTVLNVPWK